MAWNQRHNHLIRSCSLTILDQVGKFAHELNGRFADGTAEVMKLNYIHPTLSPLTATDIERALAQPLGDLRLVEPSLLARSAQVMQEEPVFFCEDGFRYDDLTYVALGEDTYLFSIIKNR